MSAERTGPRVGGAYALVLRVQGQAARVRVGSLGEIEFRPGYFCYVGTAARGLAARLERHLRRTDKRRHWHVDYLVERAETLEAIFWPTQRRAECVLSGLVRAKADGEAPGFGSSDCRCRSHLYYFRRSPLPVLLKIRLEGLRPRRFRRPHRA